jgi:hypothetical protein
MNGALFAPVLPPFTTGGIGDQTFTLLYVDGTYGSGLPGLIGGRF